MNKFAFKNIKKIEITFFPTYYVWSFPLRRPRKITNCRQKNATHCTPLSPTMCRACAEVLDIAADAWHIGTARHR